MRTITRLVAFPAMALAACGEPSRPSEASGPLLGSVTEFELVSTIAFVSTRDNPALSPLLGAEVYILDEDGSNARRLTENQDGDGLPALSPDGKKLVFDSNRRRTEGEPLNTSDLFLMEPDGGDQVWLTRGSSATWSPDSKWIALHASASGTALPIKPDPGAATFDSDIFVANVDELLEGAGHPTNITNSADWIDDDPDWSGSSAEAPGGRIVFTRHLVTDSPTNSVTAEIHAMNPDGSGLTRLTFNAEEERAPSWSSDGSRIAFMCRRGGSDFEICVMNADGTGQLQLTDNSVLDATPSWSPEDDRILFARGPAAQAQLWILSADELGQWHEQQLTSAPGGNLLANWGVLRVRQ